MNFCYAILKDGPRSLASPTGTLNASFPTFKALQDSSQAPSGLVIAFVKPPSQRPKRKKNTLHCAQRHSFCRTTYILGASPTVQKADSEPEDKTKRGAATPTM